MGRWLAAWLVWAALGFVAVSGAARAEVLSADDARVYRQALQAADEDKFDYARSLASKVPDKLLGRVIVWIEYQRPASGATFEQISSFVRANPTWPQIPTLIRRAEEAITLATPADLLKAWFEVYPPVSAEGAMAYARVLQNQGQADQATALLRHAWIDNSFGASQEREFLLHFASAIRPEDDVARLDRLLWDHQDEAALAQMRRVDDAHKRLARTRMALAHGLSHAESIVAGLPEAERDDPGLVYELIHFRRERNHEDEAIPLLKSPGADKWRGDLWWTERSLLARYALQKGNISEAYAIASAHGALDGASYAEAEWLAGWIALRFLHDTPVAETHFANLYNHVVTPVAKARGAYWSGRAFEDAKDPVQALHWYTLAAANPTTYYGQLAAARQGPNGTAMPCADPVPTKDDIEAFNHNELVHVARMLGEAGQTDLLRPFLLRLIDISSSPGIRVEAANLAATLGRSDIAIAVAHRSEREGMPLIASGYPMPPMTVGDKPERALILGLVRQESGFQHTAVSSAGARGLMQLMPATAAKLARAIKLVFKRKKALDSALTQDSNLNLRLGSVYLLDLLQQFNGSYILAVAAYNAGPARVEKWIHEFGDPRAHDVDAVDWIETIPFAETRNYVQRVLEGVQVYRQRLGTATVAGAATATGLAMSLDGDLRRARGD